MKLGPSSYGTQLSNGFSNCVITSQLDEASLCLNDFTVERKLREYGPWNFSCFLVPDI